MDVCFCVSLSVSHTYFYDSQKNIESDFIKKILNVFFHRIYR